MIPHNTIVSFCILSLLKYNRIFCKNLEYDTYGVNKVLDPALCGGSVQDLVPEIYVSFLFYVTFK